MKVNRKYFLVVVLMIFSGLALFLHANTSSHSFLSGTTLQVDNGTQFSADLTTDDDTIYAEDNDGDDLSETLARLLPLLTTTLAFFVFFAVVASQYTPVVRTVRRNSSPSFLKVFRI